MTASISPSSIAKKQRMAFDDQEILRYLRDYIRGYERPSWGTIDSVHNPYDRWPDQLPGGSTLGGSGVRYYYTKRAENQQTKLRQVADGSGHWMRAGGEIEIRDTHGGRAAGFKQRFDFVPGEKGRNVRPTWVMTKYTIHPNKRKDNKMAICVVRGARD